MSSVWGRERVWLALEVERAPVESGRGLREERDGVAESRNGFDGPFRGLICSISRAVLEVAAGVLRDGFMKLWRPILEDWLATAPTGNDTTEGRTQSRPMDG
jgi:hypothetical protein